MIENQRYFAGSALASTLLAARGFDAKSGARSGGIKSPAYAELPIGTLLLRTYQDPARLFGGWWFTPHEIRLVIDYFGIGGSMLATGRSSGRGILQGTLAVRHEWGSRSPDHMGLIAAVRLVKPLGACFGEGDVAPDDTQRETLKPIQINDPATGRRGVRQVFLPDAWTYPQAFGVLERDCQTDADLERLVGLHDHGPQPFERGVGLVPLAQWMRPHFNP